MKKKRIAFLNIFCDSHGGGEVYLNRLINAISPNISSDSFLISPDCPALENVKIRHELISGIPINNEKFNIRKCMLLIRQIRQILKLNEIDTLVVSGDRAIAIFPLLKYHGYSVGIKHMLIQNRKKYWINFWGFKSISKIITISNFHKNNYSKWFSKEVIEKKLIVIYNSVNTSYFHIPSKVKSDVIKFVEVASIEKRKGQLDLIKAFSELKKLYDNIELHFYGQGIDMDACCEYVCEIGLNDSIFFHGHTDNIKNIYVDKSTIFILPSYDEGLPLSILEALSCSTPIISTSIAGIPETIENGVNGFLIQPGDLNQLKDRMEYFILNPFEIRLMGEKSRQIAISKFDETNWIKLWQNILV